ncbi:hypothetical protein GUJ93_ZPchr0006g45041 [Zizania palustris]|uniref:Uncharacterized protein n=1 Tax=Zizania palustris TaxID=103762 RepID=A0A8J5T4Q7_ZIZPA|nr:hypothetical protein GUJ93_ZPchr0006g45041 [Zizania palustris]
MSNRGGASTMAVRRDGGKRRQQWGVAVGREGWGRFKPAHNTELQRSDLAEITPALTPSSADDHRRLRLVIEGISTVTKQRQQPAASWKPLRWLRRLRKKTKHAEIQNDSPRDIIPVPLRLDAW